MLDHDIERNLNIHTYRKELTSDEKLRLIFTYAGKIANESKLDNLLQLMADLGRDLIVADRCTLWILDHDKNELWTRVAHGIKEIRIPADTGVVGYVVKTEKPYFTDDAYTDPNFNREVDKKTGYRSKAMLAIPLFDNEGDVLGAYQAVNKMTEAEVFSQTDIDQLMMAASYSEKSLVNVILNEEIEKTQKEIIFLMAEIGESRSKETGYHVKRVAEISKLLAELSGMPKEEAELIKLASPMHDIGKVAIPDSILKKPGKLTDEEFDEMKSHTTVGYQLLVNSNRRILKASAIIAHQHHEKWNGRGYPCGLKEEEIHPYGRISAIADVFDALASDRCYKPAWELDRVLNLFKEEKGQHFDPHMTQVFIDNFDKFVAIKNKYKDK
ncbi:HD domain-containing phosphohydrolase [Desulfuribacillus alkaliarsenatis]|uniref:Histidine kinase n=1 Tax=Desulfuribacillus alkaliarsenatis TaxID=766136 RepID=A0A1E5G205_9FIRM|nr:HD domain-containing phosphohydrolase [Desulfuribacillus alkaliarsenatis]OEF96856.1 histidine kinase [Desulfuribacillus alkaliarsenatis]